MCRYVFWIADGGVFTEDRNPPIKDGDITSVILDQLNSTYHELAGYQQLTMPSVEALSSDIAEGKNELDIFNERTPELAKELLAIYNEKEKARVKESTTLLANIKDTVIALSKEGFINIIIGFRDPKFTKQVLEREGIAKLFHIVNTKTEGCRLPDRSVWDELIVKDFPGIKVKDTLFMAKESAEMVFANKIGMPFIWIRSSGGDQARCAHLKPIMTAYNTNQCLPFITQHFLSLQNKKAIDLQSKPTVR